MTNELERMVSHVRAQYPDTSVEWGKPLNKTNGTWFVWLKYGDLAVDLEWRPQKGQGISFTEDEGYNTNPEEVHTRWDTATKRMLQLFSEYSISTMKFDSSGSSD